MMRFSPRSSGSRVPSGPDRLPLWAAVLIIAPLAALSWALLLAVAFGVNALV
jgi:hypothetical protein